MHQTLEMLQRYQAAARVGFVGPLGAPLETAKELKRLLEAVARDGGAGAAPRPASMNLDALWRRWQQAPGKLDAFTRRELRALCWDERAVGDSTFLSALESAGHLPHRLSFMRGVWHAYQAHWRSSNAAVVERLLKAATDAAGHHPRWLRALRARPRLLGQYAHIDVAEGIAGDGWQATPHLEAIGVTPTGQLGARGVGRAREEWLDEVRRQRGTTDVADLVDAGRAGLLEPALCERGDFQATVERLLGTVAGSGSSLRDALARMIVTDQRLGRPTQPSSAHNWATYSRESRSIAVRLFAARDLKAFFELLIGQQDDYQRRRQFWERYVNSAQLTDFAIACDPLDRQLLLSRWGRERGDVARLIDSPEHHSAFLMRFQGRYDIIIAEISKPNNAMYLFQTQIFEQVVGELNTGRFLFAALKNAGLAQERWIHSGAWHDRFEERLRGSYGVYPRGCW